MKRNPFDPIDTVILKTLDDSKVDLTPTQIAKMINIHPVTAQKRIRNLEKQNLVICKNFGNRTYCVLNRARFK